MINGTMELQAARCFQHLAALALPPIGVGRMTSNISTGNFLSRNPSTGIPQSSTKEYRAWSAMKRRCFDKKCKAYRNYGGRGISVCKEWRHNFEAFYAHIGPAPGKEYSVDRINTNGNYEPGNVRWATSRQQAQNTRVTRNISFNGEVHCLSEWARRTGIHPFTLQARVAKGWSAADALNPEKRCEGGRGNKKSPDDPRVHPKPKDVLIGQDLEIREVRTAWPNRIGYTSAHGVTNCALMTWRKWARTARVITDPEEIDNARSLLVEATR